MPHAYVVIDIETGFASEAVIERALAGWTAPSNVKDPDKIAERRQQAAAGFLEKSALLDGSPITSIALVCGKDRQVFAGPDEVDILTKFRSALDAATGPETVLVGHNICGFDLPRLRSAFIRLRLVLPMALRLDNDEEKRAVVFDTMRSFRYFSSERHEDRFVSLADVIDAFGLPRYKDGISGKDMPALAKSGKWDTIREYNLLDAVATEAVYLLMNSTHKDMK